VLGALGVANGFMTLTGTGGVVPGHAFTYTAVIPGAPAAIAVPTAGPYR
jgi:hypothetical protein